MIMHGFLLVDPTPLTNLQIVALTEMVRVGRGWRHPDGVRWIVPVDGPKTIQEKCLREGWAKESIEVAH